jgi:LmbE family N-acetylglucosaminyl deacetylase
MGDRCRKFLAGLPDPERAAIAARDTAVVIAHPDDETIGCGALLGRLGGVTVVLVTDGAPRNLADARAHGFAAAEDYAAARACELAAALDIAGVSSEQVVKLGVPDQEAAFRLAELARRLAAVFAESRTALVLTHAYEGGHPDHDATAFAVNAAAQILARNGQTIAVIEMPFYRLGPHGMLTQSFAGEPSRLQVTVPLSATERSLKRRMIAAHETQRQTLAPFTVDVERFRPAPAYDFSALPNGGRLLYETHDWGMTGERWLKLAGAALRELAAEPVARCA